jgi:hypothetical protein
MDRCCFAGPTLRILAKIELGHLLTIAPIGQEGKPLGIGVRTAR